MVCVGINDDFVLKQDICVMCGAIGKFICNKLDSYKQTGFSPQSDSQFEKVFLAMNYEFQVNKISGNGNR